MALTAELKFSGRDSYDDDFTLVVLNRLAPVAEVEAAARGLGNVSSVCYVRL